MQRSAGIASCASHQTTSRRNAHIEMRLQTSLADATVAAMAEAGGAEAAERLWWKRARERSFKLQQHERK